MLFLLKWPNCVVTHMIVFGRSTIHILTQFAVSFWVNVLRSWFFLSVILFFLIACILRISSGFTSSLTLFVDHSHCVKYRYYSLLCGHLITDPTFLVIVLTPIVDFKSKIIELFYWKQIFHPSLTTNPMLDTHLKILRF